MAMKGTRIIRGLARCMPRVAPLALITAGALAMAAPLPAASAAARPVPPGLGGQNWAAIPTHAKVAALTFDAGAIAIAGAG